MNENLNEQSRAEETASWVRSLHSRAKRRLPLKFVALAVFGIPLFGLVVMLLWNWLAPSVFGLHSIGFLQALGILVLSRILFGGFHGRARGGSRMDRRMLERWEKMTPEERQKMVEALRAPRHSPA